ncbi:MAG: 50S ribosomal protein L22 [Bacilli bacterium]|nr:50S ribosomal protein L22 [Bacilli bacterium]
MQETEVKAVLKTVRITPRKTRLIINLIRGKKVAEAKAILANQPQKAARIIEKVLNSAISNAVNNNNMNEEDLYVKKCFVDEGLVMKRAKMDSRGHVGRNDHKTSHITVIVSNEKK